MYFVQETENLAQVTINQQKFIFANITRGRWLLVLVQPLNYIRTYASFDVMTRRLPPHQPSWLCSRQKKTNKQKKAFRSPQVHPSANLADFWLGRISQNWITRSPLAGKVENIAVELGLEQSWSVPGAWAHGLPGYDLSLLQMLLLLCLSESTWNCDLLWFYPPPMWAGASLHLEM